MAVNSRAAAGPILSRVAAFALLVAPVAMLAACAPNPPPPPTPVYVAPPPPPAPTMVPRARG